MLIHPDDMVQSAEIAALLGQKRDTVSHWAARGHLPPAIRVFRTGKAYYWPDVLHALYLSDKLRPDQRQAYLAGLPGPPREKTR